MQDVAEASEEVLWTAGFAVVTAVLLFALLAGITWAATMLPTRPGVEPKARMPMTGFSGTNGGDCPSSWLSPEKHPADRQPHAPGKNLGATKISNAAKNHPASPPRMATR